MNKPLTHTGESVYNEANPVGTLVYYMGEPQRIGIVREYRPGKYRFDSEVLVEWQSGKKVWKHAGSMITIESKIAEEKRVLRTLYKRRWEALQHFSGILNGD